MSILVVHLVPEGMLFAADRNITTWRESGGVRVVGQAQRPKVLRWPNRDAIVGYVGQARIEDAMTDEWLYAFIGRNIDFPDFATAAGNLTDELNALMASGAIRTPLIVHFGGFERVGDDWTPRIWFIRNTTELTPEEYKLGAQFDASDEIPKPPYYPGKTGSEIRAALRGTLASGGLLSFSFRQGIDLGSFNAIDSALRAAMEAIVHTHPLRLHPFPDSLDEWAKHLRMAVLGFSAYFGAFYAPYEQYVGGGADVVSVPWP